MLLLLTVLVLPIVSGCGCLVCFTCPLTALGSSPARRFEDFL